MKLDLESAYNTIRYYVSIWCKLNFKNTRDIHVIPNQYWRELNIENIPEYKILYYCDKSLQSIYGSRITTLRSSTSVYFTLEPIVYPPIPNGKPCILIGEFLPNNLP